MDFTISKEGGELTNTQALAVCIRSLPDGTYKFAISKERKTRTSQQNKYLWGVAYPILLVVLRDQGGWELTDVDQVHELCKHMFASEKVFNKHTGEAFELPTSTAAMNTVEFSTYVDKLRDLAMEMFNTEIPLPDPQIYLPVIYEDRRIEDAKWTECEKKAIR